VLHVCFFHFFVIPGNFNATGKIWNETDVSGGGEYSIGHHFECFLNASLNPINASHIQLGDYEFSCGINKIRRWRIR
jgi:hypothetical protein